MRASSQTPVCILRPLSAGTALLCLLMFAACGDTERASDADTGTSADASFDAGVDGGADARSDTEPADTSTDISDAGVEDTEEPLELREFRFEASPLEELTRRAGSYCTLDYECAPGAHCFAGLCATRCTDDTDCSDGAACDERGRCSSSAKEADAAPAPVDARLRDGPTAQTFVGASDEVVMIDVSLAGEGVPAELEYVVEDSEGLSDASVVRTTPVRDGVATIDIPISRAALDATTRGVINARVTTAAGSFTTLLVPEPTTTGSYSGYARAARFGSVELPIAFDVVTTPTNARLADAESAFIVLPVAPSRLFNPTTRALDVPYVARPLTYDTLLGSWVAATRFDYPLDAGSFLRSADGVTPQRSLRIELQQDTDGALFGQFTDRWVGFYDARTAGGVMTPAVVAFDGQLELTRVGDSAYAAETLAVTDDDDDRRTLQPLPPLDACSESMFTTASDAPVSWDGPGVAWSCDIGPGAAIASSDAFASADDAAASSCALAIAETALDGDTTAAQLRDFFNGDGVTPGGRSFDDFMRDCAEGVDGLCRPKPEVVCARQLLARAFTQPAEASVNAAAITDAFNRVSREIYLGQQLGAYRTDAELRLQWLQLNDLPDFVTASLRDWIASRLDAWRTSVLDVHLETVAGQYDPAGLALLSRQVTDADALAARQQLLFEMSQSWRSAMRSLTLATLRWNTLHVAADDRARDASLVQSRALDLYVLAGVAGALNQRAGAGFANATFSGGFGELLRGLRQLSLPFNALAYARDAEVVVARSLDPSDNNYNLLQRLEDAALAEIDAAADAVNAIVTEAADNELDETLLRNQLNNQIAETAQSLVDLCGLPDSCSLEDVTGGVAGCAVRTAPGACGFAEDGAGLVTGTVASQAAESFVAWQQAVNNITAAQSEWSAADQRAARMIQRAGEFQVAIQSWNDSRLAAAAQVDAIVANAQTASNAAFAAVMSNIGQQNALRRQLAADASSDAARWNQIRVDGVNSDFTRLRAALGLRQGAEGIGFVVDTINAFTDAAVASLPRVAGVSNDPSAAARGSLYYTAAGLQLAARKATLGMRVGAELIQLGVERSRAVRAADLEKLRDEDDADDLALENEVENLRQTVQANLSRAEVAEFQVDRLIEALEQRRNAELAYQRDLVEYNDRLDAVQDALSDIAALNIRVAQAELQALQRSLEYLRVVQQASLVASRFADLVNQRDNINLLLGSPSVVFGWASRLEQAENRLNEARSATMDWLVAMEYYAVRPFMDQRIQLLLARNTWQLAAIADDMSRLQSVCGGPYNNESADVSMARELGVDIPVRLDSGEVLTPETLFYAALQRGDVQVDRRVRLGTDVSGFDLSGRSDLLSTVLTLDINAFSNLASTCNARIDSFDVQLVGEGLGDARPTVSIVYEGTSSTRSCQPDLADYVSGLDPGSTGFNDVTTFRSPSRAISIIAGINTFPSDVFPDGVNRSLSGLPLATSYTLIIDPTAGENRSIDWTQLDDIRVRINYAYQDFFPRGECL